MKIAVIGAGVAGIVSAYLLEKAGHAVTIYEKAPKIGGHTYTLTVKDTLDAEAKIDLGFIVLNDQTYPCFHEFLKQLNIPWRFADMSFSTHNLRTGLCYGSRNLDMLFAQRRNLLSPTFLKAFCLELPRFWRRGKEILADAERYANVSLSEFAKNENFSNFLLDSYLVPISAAIWSSSKKDIYNYPIVSLLRFYNNHGLLGYLNQPHWQTVVGGSRSYIDAFVKQFRGTIKTQAAIKHVHRNEQEVRIQNEDQSTDVFDHVVFAVHADQVLSLISPTDEEKNIFSAWEYQLNRTILHTDTSFLPPVRRAWASWNYALDAGESEELPASVTYWMNNLQGLSLSKEYCVTLNPRKAIAPEKIIHEVDFHHPIYSPQAVATQPKLKELVRKDRTSYCGSYFRFGFHEDAVMSAVAVGNAFGVSL